MLQDEQSENRWRDVYKAHIYQENCLLMTTLRIAGYYWWTRLYRWVVLIFYHHILTATLNRVNTPLHINTVCSCCKLLIEWCLNQSLAPLFFAYLFMANFYETYLQPFLLYCVPDWVKLFGCISQWHEMYCHDMKVISSNPSWVKLGVHSTSVLSRTWTKNIYEYLKHIVCHYNTYTLSSTLRAWYKWSPYSSNLPLSFAVYPMCFVTLH